MKMNRWLPCLAFALGVAQSWAACTVSATGVAFGAYDPFSSASLDSTGNVAVTCNPSTPYTIALSPGNAAQSDRRMLSGANILAYNLFTDATRTAVWGDGTGATLTVSGSGIAGGHPIYGRIPARQNVAVGIYSDAITVTVTF
jgi:spore coat protein U-like protein